MLPAPYVSFTAEVAFSEAFDRWLNEQYRQGRMNVFWELVAYFGPDRRLWYRLSPPALILLASWVAPWRRADHRRQVRRQLTEDMELMIRWLGSANYPPV